MKEIQGSLDAKGVRLAVVVSRFNSFLTEQLVKGAEDCFLRHGGSPEDFMVVRVPGANEIPIVAQGVAASGKVDAIVAVGAVVQGATPHAELIESTVAKALCKIGLDSGVPVLNGVVAAENLQQAIERCGTKMGNKGFDTTMAALETVAVLRAI